MNLKLIILLFSLIFGYALAHDETDRVYLSLENNRLVSKDYQGQALNLVSFAFGQELEWDERMIYQNLDQQGVPIDGAGNPLLVNSQGASDPTGTPNEAYTVDDYAWNTYPNSLTLSVSPSADGSVDNLEIGLHILSPLKIWDGSSFVESSAHLEVATWHWTNVAEDGISDENDARHFPDGGWYAYPINPVSPEKAPVDAGQYAFAPDDHYHWLFTLSPQAQAGVYLLELAFQHDTLQSEPFYFLLIRDLGPDWAKHESFLAAKATLD